MKATFIDFEDSFSYNVVQELTQIGLDVEVIAWNDFDKNPTEGLLVLGPGPGHPDDYERIFPQVSEWLKNRKPFFGVCLGHQIFWRLQGEEVVRSKDPKHGQKILLNLSPSWRQELKLDETSLVYVQRYNSLCVSAQPSCNPELKNFIQDDEILITKSSHILTYQFHPESIGTSYHKEFMELLYSIIFR